MGDDTRFEDNQAPEYFQSGRQYHHFWKNALHSGARFLSQYRDDFIGTRYRPSGRQYLKCCHLGDNFWEKLHKVKTIFVTVIVGKATKHLFNLSKNGLEMVWTIFQPF